MTRSILLMLTIGILLTGRAAAQDASQRSLELAAALDKSKYKKKEKKGSSRELYVDVKNVIAVRDAVEYSGRYTHPGYEMDLRVSSDGRAEASGFVSNWSGKERRFTLSKGRVSGALLTGLKVYENGETESFEAIFVERTVVSVRNADNISSSDTIFGLGFIEPGPAGAVGDKSWSDRVFLEKVK